MLNTESTNSKAKNPAVGSDLRKQEADAFMAITSVLDNLPKAMSVRLLKSVAPRYGGVVYTQGEAFRKELALINVATKQPKVVRTSVKETRQRINTSKSPYSSDKELMELISQERVLHSQLKEKPDDQGLQDRIKTLRIEMHGRKADFRSKHPEQFTETA